MKLTLSSFLQWRFNILLYSWLGWSMAFSYIVMLGKIYFFFNRNERLKIETSLKISLWNQNGEDEITGITRDVFQGILSHYYEKIFNAYAGIEELKNFFQKSIRVGSFDALDNALKTGKGVLFVTGHYGGVEYIPIFLGMNRYPVSVVAKFATRHLKESTYLKTKDLGIKLIDAGREARVLPLVIRELKANRIVFIECDEIEEWRPSPDERMFFLRKVIGVDKTINLIQRRTHAEVVLGLLHRYSMRDYRLIMKPYYEMSKVLGRSACSLGETILKSFEQYVYSYPEEWYQWKNYADIETLSEPEVNTENPRSLSLLKPAFGDI